MSTMAVYGLKQCSTCQKARQWLDAHDIEHQFIDYRAQPIDPAQLSSMAAQLGWEKLVNRASMTWRGLPEMRKQPADEASWLALVAEFPALIKRPLLVHQGKAQAGFNAKAYASLFGVG